MFEEMINDVIKKYGFEANETITFCTMCELVEKGLMEEKGKFSLVKMYEILMESWKRGWQSNRNVIELNHQEKGENKNV